MGITSVKLILETDVLPIASFLHTEICEKSLNELLVKLALIYNLNALVLHIFSDILYTGISICLVDESQEQFGLIIRPI